MAAANVAHEVEKLDVSDPIERLNLGFEKFKRDFFDKYPEITEQLKKGQWPTYMVIACADSRVSPTAIFSFKPGDAFVIRNVANLVPAYEKEGYPSIGSAVEYAVLHLKVKHILVVGHRACGGIHALVTKTPDDGNYITTFIERWVAIGKPARATVNEKLQGEPELAILKAAEKESVNHSLSNLLTYPFVVDAVKENKVSLLGAYYDHMEGSLQTWAA